MATYKFTDNYGTYHRIHREFVKSEFLKAKLDFSLQTLNAGDGDIVQIPIIPPKCWVLGAWVRVRTACPANSTIDLGYGDDPDYWGSGLSIDSAGTATRMLSTSKTWVPDRIYAGSEETIEVELDGVSAGDHVSISTDSDLADMTLSSEVIVSNRVTVTLTNNTDGSLNIPSVTFGIVADKSPLGSLPVYFESADTIDVVATTDFKDVDISSGVIEVWAWIARTMKG